jgi:mono/diheme cytochrome c family protein
VKPNVKILALFCLAAFISAPVFAQGGAETYKAKCLMCHGADGLGNTPVGKSLKIVSFKDPSVVKSSNAALETIIKNGKNKMPAFAGKLSDAQIGEVVGYIRTLQK